MTSSGECRERLRSYYRRITWLAPRLRYGDWGRKILPGVVCNARKKNSAFPHPCTRGLAGLRERACFRQEEIQAPEIHDPHHDSHDDHDPHPDHDSHAECRNEPTSRPDLRPDWV